MEVTTVRSFSGFSITPSFPPRRKFHPTLAKKKDNESQQQQPPFSSLRISNSNLARAAIGVFGLGFIDAGLVTCYHRSY